MTTTNSCQSNLQRLPTNNLPFGLPSLCSHLHGVHSGPLGSGLHHHLQVVVWELSVQAKGHAHLWVKQVSA